MPNRFWVGGSGTWNSASTAHWSTTSGGGGGATLPAAVDVAIFDGLSGGGTVVVDSPNGAGLVLLQGLTFGAFTGTLDFATNNNNVAVTTSVSGTGTGIRTLNMGDGQWTLNRGAAGSTWNFITSTNLALFKNGSTIVIAGTGAAGTSFHSGGLSWGPITVGACPNASITRFEPGGGAGGTYASMDITGPVNIEFRESLTHIFTGGITGTGTASGPISIGTESKSATAASLFMGAVSSIDYGVFRGITGLGSNINATNSFGLGTISGNLFITPPAVGSGGGPQVIG